ncbi:penicillin-binding transpeptidase domain-containing protein [Thalassotalea euphylliae]|uniref:penicillin-binding transpeptidase domain-containing protein n=1 Tax=Thalassotalea euphylliae TaxID=1655234 RepID=UPI00363D0008
MTSGKILSSIVISLCIFTASAITASASANESLPCETQTDACSFVFLNASGELFKHNPKRADTRYRPFSTFKIPNSMIALDTGVVNDLSQTFSANTNMYPPESWWPSSWTSKAHTLRSAYQVSAVPLYREFATQIGEQRMVKYLADFDYGNQNISSGLDNFWLEESIKISATEQVSFLRKLYHQELPLKNETYALLKPLTEHQTHPTHVIYAKTGTGTLSNTLAEGWFVGAIEDNGQWHIFAAHASEGSFRDVVKKRMIIAEKYLSHYGYTLHHKYQ